MANNAFERLLARIAAHDRQIAALGTKLNNVVREGKVTEFDPAKGTVRVDAHGIVTDHVPVMQQAGSVNEWTPMSVGQRVVLISPSGDVGRSFAMPGGYTNETPAPHDQEAQKRITIGGVSMTITGDGVEINAGGTTFVFTAAGFVQTGGMQEHDNKNVGSTHRHTQVQPGSGLSGIPS